MPLRVEGLGVTTDGATLLEGVSFTIERGRRLGIIGEAGAGKSLLALAVLDLLPEEAKASGTVQLTDDAASGPAADFIGESPRHAAGPRVAGLLPDAADGLDPLRTIGTQIKAALQLTGADANARVEALLADIDIPPAKAAHYLGDLDAPRRQLLMVALALAPKPQLLVADDPTAGLDLLARRRVVDLIEKHCTERSMSLLLISHDLKAVAVLCDGIAVMRQGRIVEMGERENVLGRPRHQYTRALIAGGRHRGPTLMPALIGPPLLELRQIDRMFRPSPRSAPIMVLDRVSLSIRVGEALALVGPAGAGKSTLIRIIAGFEAASGGELEFDREVYHGADLPARLRREIALIAGDPKTCLNPRLTIGESIAEPLRLEPLRSIDELSARITEVVNAVGFAADVLARRPGEFSAGQRQRLAVARALITRPRLLLLDEPVERLDIAARGEMLRLLNRLRADFGVTLVLATQDLEVMRLVADRALVMERGRIVETGTPTHLLDTPEQPLTRRLVAAALPEVSRLPVF